MFLKFNHLFSIATATAILLLPSCLGNNEETNYQNWMNQNLAYFDSISILTDAQGKLEYEQISPDWDKSFSILMKWHNESEDPSNKITPLSTSTCVVNYTLTNIAGDTLDSSNSFKCVPNNMITGFMTAVTNMRVNDTVTAVIPYTAGYGAYGSGGVLPYSTLIFGIRLDSIAKLL